LAHLAPTADSTRCSRWPKQEQSPSGRLRLTNNSPKRIAALVLVLLGNDWDWLGAEREARRAVSLNPSDPDAHNTLALCLQARRRRNHLKRTSVCSLYKRWKKRVEIKARLRDSCGSAAMR
jgi:hypothetical protein